MSTTNLASGEAIEKLKDLVEDIDICLFCTNLKTGDGATTRPMSTQEVDDEGNMWFFSDINSDKNREIKNDKRVQLFYSHPGKSSYVVVNGEAEVIIDREKTEEIWSPMVKAWFKEGKDDPNISILKVTPTSAYYWDMEGNRMINFFKMIASVATGKKLVDAQEGSIKV
ncbi:pyridoxamine 5'-phosphate oxidase family protein [soil metagenome]|jgi:general stress protein 26